MQPAQTIYIKALLTACCSVLMTEAAALALAATVTDRLNLNNITLSNCEQLAHFLNAADQSNPPDWRIKFFTQLFSNYARCRQYKIFKISRSINTTADALARQAFSDSACSFESSCCYTQHVLQCSVLQARQYVNLNSVRLLTARGC